MNNYLLELFDASLSNDKVFASVKLSKIKKD